MKKLIALIAAVVASISGQVLNVPETSGNGKIGMFASSDALVVKGFTTAAYNWALVSYGIHDRVDLYAGWSGTTLLGQTQSSAFVGWNATAFKRRWGSVSNFTLVSTPLHKRRESSEMSIFASVIYAKKVGPVTPYTGYSVILPIGNTQSKLYSPAEPVHNIPAGIMIPKGKFMILGEYDFNLSYGVSQKIVGLALAYTFN